MSDIFAQAESGDIKALTELLELLYDQNSPELFKWAQKAVDTDPDNPVFLNYMGICYDENKSEETDAEYNRNMAKKCYKRGAELGYKSAAYNFAVMLMKEENPEAMLWAKKAYEMGKTEAASLIADLYQAGIGTEVDKKASFQWELKGAEAGDEYAQDGIARRYLEGNGCPMNLGEALDWFRTAAESGNSASAAELSKIYRSGQYLPVDMETSIHYALMAAKGENPEVSELFDIADRYRQACKTGTCMGSLRCTGISETSGKLQRHLSSDAESCCTSVNRRSCKNDSGCRQSGNTDAGKYGCRKWYF